MIKLHIFQWIHSIRTVCWLLLDVLMGPCLTNKVDNVFLALLDNTMTTNLALDLGNYKTNLWVLDLLFEEYVTCVCWVLIIHSRMVGNDYLNLILIIFEATACKACPDGAVCPAGSISPLADQYLPVACSVPEFDKPDRTSVEGQFYIK